MRQKSRFGWLLLFFLPLFFIDAIELTARAEQSQWMARYACFALQHLRIASLFIPHDYFDIAHTQCSCSLEFDEPEKSIVFFMMKMALVVVGGVGLSLWIGLMPAKKFPHKWHRFQKRYLKTDDLIYELDSNRLWVMGLLLFWSYLAEVMAIVPKDFDTGIGGKIQEALLCLCAFILVTVVARYAILVLRYNLKGLQKLLAPYHVSRG